MISALTADEFPTLPLCLLAVVRARPKVAFQILATVTMDKLIESQNYLFQRLWLQAAYQFRIEH